MNHLIIFEYLTAHPQKKLYQNKDNLMEGIRMIDKISLDFKKSNQIKKISVIRHSSLNFTKNKSINYFLTSKNNNWIDILKKLDQKYAKVLIIAPESNNIFSKTLKKILSLGFQTLNSELKEIRRFSSKVKTFTSLKKIRLPCVETFTSIREIKYFKSKFIVKPIFSAGSENIFIVKSFKDLKLIAPKITFPFVIQYFKPTLSGSFAMICKNKKANLISCNEHILKYKSKSLKQIGSNIGKFEKYRNDFEIIAKSLATNFSGLYGYIGVDVILEDKVWKVVDVNARFTSSYLGIKKKYGIEIKNKIIDFYCKNKLDKSMMIKTNNKNINYLFIDD